MIECDCECDWNRVLEQKKMCKVLYVPSAFFPRVEPVYVQSLPP